MKLLQEFENGGIIGSKGAAGVDISAVKPCSSPPHSKYFGKFEAPKYRARA